MSKEEVRQFNKLVQFAEERMKLKVKILIKWKMHLIFCDKAYSHTKKYIKIDKFDTWV